MGSVSATNSAVANLLQTLSTTGSSTAQSAAVTNGLESASPIDIADLSESANQLAAEDATLNLFYSSQSGATTSSENSVLQALQTVLSESAEAKVPESNQISGATF